VVSSDEAKLVNNAALYPAKSSARAANAGMTLRTLDPGLARFELTTLALLDILGPGSFASAIEPLVSSAERVPSGNDVEFAALKLANGRFNL